MLTKTHDVMHSWLSCNNKTVVCFRDTLFSSDLVLLPLFLLFPTETNFVSQHFSLFLFYCIPTGKKLEVCIDNYTRDTVTAGNFERENLCKFWGFVSICKSFLSICKSFSVNIGGVASFGSTSKQSVTVFSTEIVFSTNLWKFFPFKNFPLYGIYTCCYLQDPDGLYLTKLLLY